MKTIKDLLDAAVETEKIATMNLDEWPRNSLPSITSTVNEAKARLVVEKKVYFDQIDESTLGIFVYGNNSDLFAKIAEKEGGTITIRADSLYVQIAKVVEPAISNSREFGVTAFSKLNQGLIEVGHTLNINSMDMPRFKISKVAGFNELVNHVKYLVRNTLGDNLNELYISHEIQQKAYDAKIKSAVIPVVVIGVEDEKEIKNLEGVFSKSAVICIDNNNVSRDYVLRVFSDVKKRLYKKV